MQQVYLGRTQSGRYGYFTGGFLAFPLKEEEFNQPKEWHEAKCKRLQFQLIEKE